MAGKIRIHMVSELDPRGFDNARGRARQVAKSLRDDMAPAVRDTAMHWADFKAKLDLAGGACKKALGFIGGAIKKAFHFETIEAGFDTLLGSIDAARAHAEMLQELGDTPPFSLDEFAKASQAMLSITGGALGFKESLIMVGDAAAATGKPLDRVAEVVAKTFAKIRDGSAIAADSLEELGIVSPAVAERMKELQKSGASSAEVWELLRQGLKRYTGAMDRMAETGQGQMDTLGGVWSHAVRTFGEAFSDAAKNGVARLKDAIKDLVESGQIERWAKNTAELLGGVGKASGWISNLYRFSGAKDVMALVKATGRGIGTVAGGGSWEDTVQAYMSAWYEGEGLRALVEKANPEDVRGTSALNDWFNAAYDDMAGAAREEAAAGRQAVRAAAPTPAQEEAGISRQLSEADAARRLEAEKKAAELAEKRAAKEAELLDVRGRLISAEEALAAAERAAAAKQAVAAGKAKEIEKAKKMGLTDFMEDRNRPRQERLDRLKIDAKTDKRMRDLDRRQKAGARLSKRDRQRLTDWKDYNDLRMKGIDPFAEVDVAKEQLNSLKESVESLKKIEKGLDEALKVN